MTHGYTWFALAPGRHYGFQMVGHVPVRATGEHCAARAVWPVDCGVLNKVDLCTTAMVTFSDSD